LALSGACQSRVAGEGLLLSPSGRDLRFDGLLCPMAPSFSTFQAATFSPARFSPVCVVHLFKRILPST
jgi:hypothetical protein